MSQSLIVEMEEISFISFASVPRTVSSLPSLEFKHRSIEWRPPVIEDRKEGTKCEFSDESEEEAPPPSSSPTTLSSPPVIPVTKAEVRLAIQQLNRRQCVDVYGLSPVLIPPRSTLGLGAAGLLFHRFSFDWASFAIMALFGPDSFTQTGKRPFSSYFVSPCSYYQPSLQALRNLSFATH